MTSKKHGSDLVNLLSSLVSRQSWEGRPSLVQSQSYFCFVGLVLRYLLYEHWARLPLPTPVASLGWRLNGSFARPLLPSEVKGLFSLPPCIRRSSRSMTEKLLHQPWTGSVGTGLLSHWPRLQWDRQELDTSFVTVGTCHPLPGIHGSGVVLCGWSLDHPVPKSLGP